MGNDNIKGIKLMEDIYPPEDGKSMIPADKLAKAIEKGKIATKDDDGVEDLDEDLDAKIDAAIQEVWDYYDPKKKGFLDKKAATSFFSDAFKLYALRQNKKEKDLTRSLSKGIEASIKAVNTSGTGKITFAELSEFLNSCDIDEAMGHITGQTGPQEVDAKVDEVNSAQLAAEMQSKANVGGEIKLRDRNAEV